MPDWEAYKEADRRGILPLDKLPLYEEAKRRGLVPGEVSGESRPLAGSIPGRILHGAEVMASGANRAIAGMLGAPSDISSLIAEPLGLGKTPGGSEFWNRMLPTPVKPETTAEKYLEVGGEQIPGLLPGVGMAAKAGRLAKGVQEAVKFGAGATALGGATRDINRPPEPLTDLPAQAIGGTLAGKIPIPSPKSLAAIPSTARAIPGIIENLPGKIAGWEPGEQLKNWLGDFYKRVAENQTAKKVMQMRTTQPVAALPGIQARAETATDLQKEIPGWEANYGQFTGDPAYLAGVEKAAKMEGGAATQGLVVTRQDQALRNYINAKLEGGGAPTDALLGVKKAHDDLIQTTQRTKSAARGEAGSLEGAPPEVSGAGLVEKSEKLRTASSKYGGELYDKAKSPEKNMDPTPLADAVNEQFGSFDAFTQRLSATPTGPMKRVENLWKPAEEEVSALVNPSTGKPFVRNDFAFQPGEEGLPRVSVDQMKDFRSQMGYAARHAYAGGDKALGKKLDRLQDAANDVMVAAAKTSPEIEAKVAGLKDANDYWRGHVERFRYSSTGEILKTDALGQKIVANSQVVGKYFRRTGDKAPEGWESFRRTFADRETGIVDPEALKMAKDYAAYDLLQYARDPNTLEIVPGKVNAWLNSHNTALDKFGFQKDFAGLQRATKMAEEAEGLEAAFNRSALGKALNVDPQYIAPTLFMSGAGKKQSIVNLQRATEVARAYDRANNTPAATNGLKAAISRHFSQELRQPSGYQTFDPVKVKNFWDDYGPAIRQSKLYSKEELAAWDTVRKSVEQTSLERFPMTGLTTPGLGGVVKAGLSSTLAIWAHHLTVYGLSGRIVDKIIGGPVGSRMNEAFVKAMFDPEYAKLIQDTAREAAAISPEKAIRSFTRRMAILSELGTARVREEEKSKSKERPELWEKSESKKESTPEMPEAETPYGSVFRRRRQ